MPCSPHCRFEVCITDFLGTTFSYSTVTLISIILHMITNEGVRCISTSECCHKCNSWKNTLLSHAFAHNRSKSGATKSEQQNYMGRKWLPWDCFFHKEVQFSAYGCVISMGFSEYVIKRSTAAWCKGTTLYYRSWWEFCCMKPWKQKPFRHK